MKIVVLDDDPTGSQTVHSCPLLLSWDIDVLRQGLCHASPIFFVLADTRSLTPGEAAQRNREICLALKKAIAIEQINLQDVLLVSRGDSTLRGHGVVEPQVISNEFGPFAATFHVPAFFEGGRITVNGVHMLNGMPVHQTAFAQDRIFGYQTSELAIWLEQKSDGVIKAETVLRITLAQLDAAANSESGMKELQDWLSALTGNQVVVVDAECSQQLVALGEAVRQLIGVKRFLFRSAASFLNSLSQIGPQPCSVDNLVSMRRLDHLGKPLPGIVMVGSYVPLADAQLVNLLQESSCVGVEIPVQIFADLIEGQAVESLLLSFEREYSRRICTVLDQGKTPVVYTSRGEFHLSDIEKQLYFGKEIAIFMSRLVRNITSRLGYLISKGGITTQTIMSFGLSLKMMQLEGQLLPGLSLVRPTSTDQAVRNLPIITFPGNLGDAGTLLKAWKLMDSC